MRAKRGAAVQFVLGALLWESDDCLIWPYQKPVGYGRFWYGGRIWIVTRFVLTEKIGGPPTPKHEAAHLCNNPSCINHRHLRWVTRVENAHDKIAHGTFTHFLTPGENHPRAQRSDSDIIDIRTLYATGWVTMKALAEAFGTSTGAICDIIHRNKWKHLP